MTFPYPLVVTGRNSNMVLVNPHSLVEKNHKHSAWRTETQGLIEPRKNSHILDVSVSHTGTFKMFKDAR